MDKKIYGIRFTPSDSAPNVTRICDAAHLEYRQQVGDDVAFSDFDSCYPWSEIKECNILSDGSVVYSDDNGFSRDKNTFIEIPPFYFKRTVSGDTEEWMISGYKHDGFEIEPWFVGEKGEVLSHRYIAKYEGCDWKSGLVSATGQIPCRNHSIDEFKDGCDSVGFSLCSIYTYLALQHLFVVECATLDSQSVNSGVSYVPYASHVECICAESGVSNTATVPYHWRWETVEIGSVIYADDHTASEWVISDPRTLVSMERDGDLLKLTLSGEPIRFEEGKTRVYSSAQASGRCDSMRYINGRPSANAHTSSFIYRGIENIFGNTWEFMDGIVFSEEHSRFEVFGNMLAYETPSNHSYGQSGKGFVAKLGYDIKNPWATLPCELGASYDSHYCAEWSCFGEGRSAVVYGGGWDHFYCNGIFCMRAVFHDGGEWLYGYRAMK